MSVFTNIKSSYSLEEVSLSSERLDERIELRGITSDLEIFEHLNKPYLTARLVCVDQIGWYEATDILGGEKITITISSSKEGSFPITKEFYVSSTELKKINSDSHVVVFNLIEDIGFISNLLNVNSYYANKGGTIVETIAKQFLDRQVSCDGDDINRICLVVPNMDPIEAMQWITQRMVNKYGFPFYLFSTLQSNTLYLKNLQTLLEQPVSNPRTPFVENMANPNVINHIPRSRIIMDHRFETSEDLLTLIGKGLVGAEYEFIDSLEEETRIFNFDLKRDFYDVVAKEGLLQGQENPLFTDQYQYNAKSYNKYKSRKITMFGGSNSQRNSYAEPWVTSYREEKTAAGYKKQIISRAFDNVLKKAPLTMVVDGSDFIDGDKHSTIGQNVEIEFLKTTTNRRESTDQLDDRKRSGNYMIYAARHMFKKERYDVSLTCVKLGTKRRND